MKNFSAFPILALAVFMAGSALAQAPIARPRIGTIDFYGLDKTKPEDLRKILGVKEGDFLPRAKGDIEEEIEKLPNVVRARLEAACCDDGKAVLYVGVEERGAPHFDYNPPPAGLAMLPRPVHDEYTQFLSALGLAVRAGETEEDLRQGHSLMANSGVRKHQERFQELAKEHLEALRDVLAHSADEEHRAIAAYVIGYAPRKVDVVKDLQAALRDPDDTVRNNAARALAAIAVLATRLPEAEDPRDRLKVAPVWFVEMLDSLIWQDRMTGAATLLTLTEKRNPAVIDLLRERSMDTLREMAKWQHLAHALPAFILLGRVAGMTEEEIQAAWTAGDRSRVMAK
ncbi:MAG: hypothetical protein R2762_11805 [Bryobacteraceae bacterium]